MSDRIIVIGAGLGSTASLEKILGALPPKMQAPIVIVQHRRKDSDEFVARNLAAHCALPVTEAEDKETIRKDRVYLAPPDYHLLIDGNTFSLSTDAPVHRTRPAIDVLFECAAETFGDKAIGVLLASTAPDGTAGAFTIKQAGGIVIAERGSLEEGMSSKVIGIADKYIPAEEIGAYLAKSAQPPAPWKGMAQVVIHTNS